MSNELLPLPCPFCNSKATKHLDYDLYHCSNIGCPSNFDQLRGTHAQIYMTLDDWNTRPANDLQERIKELENFIKELSVCDLDHSADWIFNTAKELLTTPQDIKDTK